MQMLRTKLYDIELTKRQGDIASRRKTMVSTGDRSAKYVLTIIPRVA